MSQLALQSVHGLSDQQTSTPSAQSGPPSTQDSPTIGRAQIHTSATGPGITNMTHTQPPSTGARSFRKPAPSPLHASTAISPPSSASPTQSDFPPSIRTPFTLDSVPQIVTTAAPDDSARSFPRVGVLDNNNTTGKTYFDSDSSGRATPEEKSTRPIPSPRLPNDIRSVSDPVVTPKPLGGSTLSSSSIMAGLAGPGGKGAPRDASIDSTVSAMSSRSHSGKNAMPDAATGPADIANLIKTAGSPEAVIQYLLKEKHSASQQNAQLWRLVDKQRAMILGLNKDLETALKDKEKYRKKLKEFVAAAEVPPVPSLSAPSKAGQASKNVPRIDLGTPPKEQVLEVPISPGLDSDSQKHSPIDMSLAPYPITPPADHITNGPPSAVGDLLDPSHAMPKPQEHALDQFDHEAQDRAAEEARKAADAARDLPLNLNLPPSRSLPSEPPRMPPPQLPPSRPVPTIPSQLSPKLADGAMQFPPPPAAPPRKPPPAPLQLRDMHESPTVPPDDELETDSDYDDILEVDEIPADDRRGRRRTREEDDRMREKLAVQEAEMRSLSKKSKKSNSSLNGTAAEQATEPTLALPPSPRLPPGQFGSLQRDNVPSLAGVLNGDRLAPALLSPGLPSSPRPMGLSFNSPPLSPRMGAFGSAPLSPRPPRQAIPLPPNTPLQTPSPAVDALSLTSPKPLNIVKKTNEPAPPDSPAKSSRSTPTERTRVYKGLVTDEYPDLLLPPNALPSIEIRVASSRMKPSRASLISLTQLEEDPVFTLAILSRVDGGELWRVEKDSASLVKLDQRLKQCAAFTAKTPDRNLFTGHAPAKLDARRIALDQYLDELLNTPLDTATALELCKYLSINTLPPNADETTAQGDPRAEVQQTGPGGRPFRNGYLTKRGKNFGGWKARFFVLDGPHLRYYETPGGAHLGTIKLQNAQIGKQSQHNDNSSPARAPGGGDEIDNQYRHAFLILEPKKKDPSSVTKHVLCAESDRERDQWVDALLRWIDYKDPEDEEAPKKEQVHDRQGSGGSERVGANAKKKLHGRNKGGQPPEQHTPRDSEDTLISVSYETAKQGDTPLGAPSHEQPALQTMSSQSPYAISAPRDAQMISDSQAWGKLSMPQAAQGALNGGLAPPNLEEKKARKRSFFGFGTKGRSSSDGQDSLFGDSQSSSNPAPANQNNGPVRQVFGASLAEAVRYNSPVDVRVPLPAVVYRCIQYLEAKNAIYEEGIFRLSGSNVVIKQLRERFNNESDINLVTDEQYHDIHAVASLLKLYLRELPTTILTRDLHLEFLAVTEIPDMGEKTAALAELVLRLPQANATLLKYLIAFLIRIINHADSNKMTVRNVGIVFSPTLNIPAPVFAMFLQHYESIFGIEPEEYELPSPVTDSDRRPSFPSSLSERPSFQERRPSDSHQRPSTSGTSSSPNRRRLMEALQEGQGSLRGATPPPAIMPMSQVAQLNAAQMQMRNTPTPPPQRTYDPQFLAQQGPPQSQGYTSRPAYESGFVVPQGYNPAQGYQQNYPRANPGYDQPLYDNGGGQQQYDQSYTSGKNRRESMMLIGGSMGLNHQGSRSRLREESHY